MSEDQISAVVAGGADEENSLVSRLTVIEEQPLEQRAAAFAQIHDKLQQTLEGSDVGGTVVGGTVIGGTVVGGTNG